MTNPSAPCSKCKGEMTMTSLEPFQGEEGGLTLTIHDMPCLVCAQEHKRFIHLGFAAELMDRVMSADAYSNIPSAATKGFFKKHYHCPDCAAELPESPTGEKTQEVAAALKDAQPFKVVIRVPVFKCSGCGRECIHSAAETGQLAYKATGHAFRAMDIPPT